MSTETHARLVVDSWEITSREEIRALMIATGLKYGAARNLLIGATSYSAKTKALLNKAAKYRPDQIRKLLNGEMVLKIVRLSDGTETGAVETENGIVVYSSIEEARGALGEKS